MSIIYEALKKVEQSQDNPQQQQQPPKPQKKEKSNFKVYFIYALVVCLGFIAANALFSFIPKPINKEEGLAVARSSGRPTSLGSAAVLEKSAASERKLLPKILERKKKSGKTYVLNGVFFSGHDGYALINNRIVKEGDNIDGVLVSHITMDEVELLSGEETITLSNKTK